MKPLAVVKHQDVVNHVSLCCLAVHIAIMVALFCNVTKKEGVLARLALQDLQAGVVNSRVLPHQGLIEQGR